MIMSRKIMTIVAILPLLHGCEALKVADETLYSVTETVSKKDAVTGQRTLSLQDRAQQIQEGNAAAEQFISEAKASGKRINEAYNAKAYNRVKRIFSKLHQVSHVRNEQWTPMLVEENAWNAFTTGGTYFVIFSALETDLKDDNELANVIAHEMAHAVANHGFEQRSYAQLSGLTHSKSASRDSFQTAFTHENEAEADRIGILYSALAGFDPFASSRIWQRKFSESGNGASFLHDHPMNSERAAKAQQVAELVKKYYTPNQQNPDFANILADNEVFSNQSTSEPQIAAGQGGGFMAALDATLTTIQQQQDAKLEEQRQQNRIKFMQSVHQVSEIMDSAPLSQNQWRMKIQYNGNRPLTDLGFKLTILRVNQEPLVLTKQLSGILKPNMVFNVDFESNELDAYQTNPKNVSLMYDNAKSM